MTRHPCWKAEGLLLEMILIPKSSWVLSQTTNALLCTGLFCVYRRIYLPSSVRGLQAPTVFIPFTTRCILNAQFVGFTGFYSVYDQMYSQCAVCGSHWFLFCLSPHLFSEWHIVPLLFIQIKQSRVYSRKALYECKASRRLGKQIRGLSRFLSTSTYWLSRFLSKATLQHPTIFKAHTTA